jgi:hypothetical protein
MFSSNFCKDPNHQENIIAGGARLWEGSVIRAVIDDFGLYMFRIHKHEVGNKRTFAARQINVTRLMWSVQNAVGNEYSRSSPPLQDTL